jgi:hypothetical protein
MPQEAPVLRDLVPGPRNGPTSTGVGLLDDR